MAKSMTRKDVEQASDALVQWFRSQEITPSDGMRVMAHVMAIQALTGIMKRHPEGPTETVLKIIHNEINMYGDAAGDLVCLSVLDLIEDAADKLERKLNDRK